MIAGRHIFFADRPIARNMITFKVYEMMAHRGFKTRTALADAAGIHPTSIGKIVDGKAKTLNIRHLDGLCRALGCQPGDLVEYVP